MTSLHMPRAINFTARPGLSRFTARSALIVCALSMLSCSAPPAEQKKVEPAKVEAAKVKPAEPAEPAKKTEPPLSGPMGIINNQPMGKTREDVPLPLRSLLGQPTATVQSKLGEHQGKGMTRGTCVRFVPDRKFFSCQFALQRYADPTGTFSGVRVEYEDGVATALGFDGWTKGTGPFDPKQLLDAVGLELPGEPRTDTPAEGVRRWAWFNDRARLRIGDHQYRVEVSVVGDDWARSRVDVVINDPLTAAQQAKLVAPAEPAEAKESP